MSVSFITPLNLLATSLIIRQPPGPNPQQGRSPDNLLDDILRGTDEMIRSGQTPQAQGSPTATGGSTTTSTPTPQVIDQIATQNRIWFGIQSRVENSRTVFFHPTYGRCIQQLDGSYFFPEPTSEGQRTQPFTVHNRQVINNSRPLHGTISINHFNLRPLNNWLFTDSEGSVHFLQPGGTFWDLGVKTDGTRVRNSRIINGTQVVEGRPQPLQWTLGMAQLGLYPVQNTDGSFSRPGDNRKYFLQTDGTIFREGYTNTDGVQVLGSTYVNNNGTLQWDSNRSEPLANTLALARSRAIPQSNSFWRLPNDLPVNALALQTSQQLEGQINNLNPIVRTLQSDTNMYQHCLDNGLIRTGRHVAQNPGRPLTGQERAIYSQEITRLQTLLQQQRELLRRKTIEYHLWQNFIYHPLVNTLYNNSPEQFRNQFITPNLEQLALNAPQEINNSNIQNLRTTILQRISAANNNAELNNVFSPIEITSCQTPQSILDFIENNTRSRIRIAINLGTRIISRPGYPTITAFSYITREGHLVTISFSGREFNQATTQLQVFSAHMMDIALVGRRLPEAQRREIQATINSRIVSRHSHSGGSNAQPNIVLSDNGTSQNSEFMLWFFRDFLNGDLSRFPQLLAPASRFGEIRYRPFTGTLSRIS